MILEHNKKPRNFKELSPCTHHSHGKNPLCGDDYYVYLSVSDDTIDDIAFKGDGCAISKASGSMMTQALKGKSLKEALDLKELFLDCVTKDDFKKQDLMGKLKIFEGVKQFPVRVKCAALVWRALEDALDDKKSKHEVSTE